MYFSTPDFEYMGECPLPRLGNGSFTFAVQASLSHLHVLITTPVQEELTSSWLDKAMYRELTGRPLECTVFGKPYKESYEYATASLDGMAASSGHTLGTIYGVGDNPLTDIRGANGAGERWRSVLTRTGMFQGGDNDEHDPADLVVNDLLEWYAIAQEQHQKNWTSDEMS